MSNLSKFLTIFDNAFPKLSRGISDVVEAAGKATGIIGKLKAAGASALTSLSKLGGGLGTLIIPTATIVGIYALFKYINEAADRAEEKFSATSQESSELESELNSLNSELETTNAKIKELEQKGTLSFTDVEELKNLKLQNAELERSIILATQRQKVLNQQKHTDFQDMMDKYFDSRNSNGENLITNIFNAVGGQGVLTRSGIFDSRLSEYEKLKADVVQIETELISATDEGTKESLEKALSNKKSTIQEIEAYMVEEASTMQNYIESMSSMYGQDEQTDAYIDRMLDYVDKWNILSGADGARESAFERLTEITFSDTVSDLKVLGKQGKVTANDLRDSKYKDFIDNLIEIGFISDSTVPSLEDVALAFNEVTEAAEEANNAVSSDPIEQAFQNWENAQNRTQSGVKFDTLLEALDLAYDTVADKTSDVYEKIGNADYKAAIDLLIPVDAEIDETDLTKVKKYINETLKKYIKVDDDGEYSGLNVGKFLSDSVTAGIMTQDGGNYSVNSDVTLEKWAKKLDLSASTIKAILGELEEYGAEFQFFEFDEDFETLAENAKNAADALKETFGDTFTLDFDLSSCETTDEQISKIDENIKKIKDERVDPNIDPTTAINLSKTLEYCVKQKQLLAQPTVMLIDTTQVDNETTRGVIQKLQNFITAKNEFDLQFELGYDTEEAKSNLDKAIEEIQKSISDDKLGGLEFKIDLDSEDSIEDQINKRIGELNKTTLLELSGIDESAFEPALEAVESMATKIDQIFNGERTISFKASLEEDGSFKITMNTSEVNSQLDGIQDKVDDVTGHKDFDVTTSVATRNTKKTVDSLWTKLKQITSKAWTIYVNEVTRKLTSTTTKESGESKANGTVTSLPSSKPIGGYVDKYLFPNVNGVGFANGTSNFQGGTALVGELGREIAVDPNKGTWETVGDSGAEFVNLPKNAIVFNHKQTEQLLRNGKISGRGNALAGGNAFSNTGVAGSIDYSGSNGGGSSSSSTKSNSSSGSSSSDSKETVDWIETLLDRLGRVFDNFARTAEDTSKSFSARSKALDEEIKQNDKIINANKKAANIYLNKANSVGLSDALKKKVQSGSYNINDYSSSTADKIKEYKEYYEKYLEAIDTAAEKQVEKAALQLEKFELIQSKYESKFNLQDEKISYWEAVNERDELKGKGGSIVAQDEMIAIYERRIKYLKDEKKELLNNLDGIEEGTEAWYETQAAIKSLDTEILNAENDIKKLENVKIQIEYEVFETKANKYDSKISVRDGNISISEAKYERAEKQGDSIAAANAKKDEISYLRDKKSLLKAEKASLVEQLGNIEVGTEEWYKAKKTIQQIDVDLVNTDTAILEAEQAIKDIEWSDFEKISTDYDNLDKEYEQGLAMQTASNARYELKFGTGSITAQKEMQNLEASHLSDLNTELEELQKAMLGVSKEDENYEKMVQRIREVEIEIIESENQILQYDKAVKDILYSQFQNVGEQFDNNLSNLDHKANMLNKEITALETQGYKVSSKYYESQKTIEEDRMTTLKTELSALQIAFNEALATGLIKEGSNEWYDYQKKINDVNESIKDTENNILELNKTVSELDFENFKYLRDTISQLTEEADFYIDLMSDSDMYDKNGELTDEGKATLGLHGQNYEVYLSEAKEYGKKLAEVEKELANDPNNTLLIDRKNELIKAQRNSILSAQDEKQAMRDLVEDGINYELDALRELIDTYTEALDSAKDLHDYEKKIAEHNTDISSIRKQIAAYSGDNSQEAKLKIQQLQADLKEAEEDLEETEYDRYINDQKELLDEFYDEYEKILNESLDDIDKLLVDITTSINTNSSVISNTLDSISQKFGISLSEDIKSVWDSNSANPVLSAFLGENSKFSSEQTTISRTLCSIQDRVDQILTATNKEYGNGNTSSTPGTDSSSKNGEQVGKEIAEVIGDITGGLADITKGNATTENKENSLEVGNSINLSNVDAYFSPSEDVYFGNVSGLYEIADTSNDEWIGMRSVGSKTNDESLFWVKKNTLNVPAFKNGGVIDYTGLAWVDGTKSNPEYVLNAQETKSIFDLKAFVQNLANQPIGINSGNFGFEFPEQIKDISDMSSILSKLTDGFLIGEKSISVGDINIAIDKVEDYNDFVTKLKNDPKFEGLVQSLSIDLLNGKSRLAKNKYTWK